ncbi:MAG: membrane protein insertion efficiency factor YidD [Phycisphaerales bacterium JB065]
MNAETTEPASRHPLAVLNLPFILLIRVYQVVGSPFLGGQCRFQPTCSNYALDCYRTHHAIRATILTARRLGRCQPLCAGGYDPCPPYRRRRADKD